MTQLIETVASLKYFRLYFFDQKNKVTRSTDIAAATNIAAINDTKSMFAADATCQAIEIWHNARRVHRETRPDQVPAATGAVAAQVVTLRRATGPEKKAPSRLGNDRSKK